MTGDLLVVDHYKINVDMLTLYFSGVLSTPAL